MLKTFISPLYFTLSQPQALMTHLESSIFWKKSRLATKLSVFYSLTHNCYRVDYSGRYNHLHGYVDKHCRMHICTIDLSNNLSFPERLKLCFQRFHRYSLKLSLSHFFFMLSVKLNPPNDDVMKYSPHRRRRY